jgi:hypothetical protein
MILIAGTVSLARLPVHTRLTVSRVEIELQTARWRLISTAYAHGLNHQKAAAIVLGQLGRSGLRPEAWSAAH